jgi:hypothetical protein
MKKYRIYIKEWDDDGNVSFRYISVTTDIDAKEWFNIHYAIADADLISYVELG